MLTYERAAAALQMCRLMMKDTALRSREKDIGRCDCYHFCSGVGRVHFCCKFLAECIQIRFGLKTVCKYKDTE